MARNIAVLFSFFLVSPYIAYAQSGATTLSIEFVGGASATHPVTAVRSVTSVGFDSTSQLGTCALVSGKVYFETNPEDTTVTTILLAAITSGRQIELYWDDGHVTSRGHCKLSGVRMY